MKEFFSAHDKSFRNLKFLFRHRSNLNRILEYEDFDFVWFMAPAGEVLDIPFATTLWDLEFRAQPFFPEVSRYGEWKRRQGLNQSVLQRASFVIVGTNYGAAQAHHFFGVDQRRILVAPFALHSLIEERVDKRDPNLIFFPAQFWPHKNHTTLVKAFKLAREKSGRNLRLILPGSDKGNFSLIKKYVEELKLTESVDFPGFISNIELTNLYKTAALMVYPSLFGPDNLPPLESLLHGCPVIVADIPGSKEQLGDSVEYFNPVSEIDLSNRILENLDRWASFEKIQVKDPEETLRSILIRIAEFECYIRTWKFMS